MRTHRAIVLGFEERVLTCYNTPDDKESLRCRRQQVCLGSFRRRSNTTVLCINTKTSGMCGTIRVFSARLKSFPRRV
jgi:hypothetical protein